MSYAQDLASRYTAAHKRLMGPLPARLRYTPTPPIAKPDEPRVAPNVSLKVPVIENNKPTLKQLLNWVAQKEVVDSGDIVGPRRDKNIVHPRKCFYYLAYRYSGCSFTQIARYCNRDHTTVIDGFYKICELIEKDPIWCSHIREYTDQLDLQIEEQSKICPFCGK